ncbi:QcrA and Rieske domain-containing protein [Salmonirosea aquatica]|uniref:Rieske 2Fe-2S domain-containing protein n=1 Tax=Salmonirosea aquatica TaxID=2654236 RepID=A0A7C9F3K7_9BACT|nr:Rieske 2Fe-2S domain-containing protein [Cytophagaceae bacterium SJW1-29]
METQEKKIVSRGEFLRSLGMSSSALMAFYCMGTLTACSSKDDDPTPGGNTGGNNTNAVTGTTTGSNIDFTIDLTAYKEKNLKTEGEFAVIGDAIVIALSNQKYVALSKKCTHEGFTVGYRKAENDIRCANHGSEFKLDGSVQMGPAASPLTVFKTTLSADGNSLTVKA